MEKESPRIGETLRKSEKSALNRVDVDGTGIEWITTHAYFLGRQLQLQLHLQRQPICPKSVECILHSCCRSLQTNAEMAADFNMALSLHLPRTRALSA
jgi:hypothetical protein